MKIEIKRYKSGGKEDEYTKVYELPSENMILLDALTYIKTKLDATLTFTSGCRSCVCGSCALRVNGKEELACVYKLSDGDVIAPLKNLSVIKDLVVNTQQMLNFNFVAKAWSSDNNEKVTILPEDAQINELQSDCILCGACYSACPVYEVNKEFIAPFSLTRSWRYVSDKREKDILEKIEAIQKNGIWDCTLCGECVPVCPQAIAPKQDIAMLRNKSNIMGFVDPNYSAVGGFNSFDSGLSFL